MPELRVTVRGARRWAAGHPWIYRSDLVDEGGAGEPGVVEVGDERGRFLGRALYSPRSEIRLRLLTREDEPVDGDWWARRVREAVARREGIGTSATSGCRLVHAEADGLPSLIVDRYGAYLSVQLLSAGLETCRPAILAALIETVHPRGIVLRNDSPVRRHEGLPLEVETAAGEVPDEIEIEEGEIRYGVAPRGGHKTGAYLDQRDNRVLAGSLARGRTLDAFSYEGVFAVQLARHAERVLAADQSPEVLARAEVNAERNGLTNIDRIEANAFDLLRDLERRGERFDVIVLDPPAFARTKSRLPRALAGYNEINLRAMRLLVPGGHLLTFSCSHHVGRNLFLEMLANAARDAGGPIVLERLLGPPPDHPEILTIPETGYLKGALLRARR